MAKVADIIEPNGSFPVVSADHVYVGDVNIRLNALLSTLSGKKQMAFNSEAEVTDPSEDILYLIKNAASVADNVVYDMKLYNSASRSFTTIGTTKVDLSNYVQKGDLNGLQAALKFGKNVHLDAEGNIYADTVEASVLEPQAKDVTEEGFDLYLGDQKVGHVSNGVSPKVSEENGNIVVTDAEGNSVSISQGANGETYRPTQLIEKDGKQYMRFTTGSTFVDIDVSILKGIQGEKGDPGINGTDGNDGLPAKAQIKSIEDTDGTKHCYLQTWLGNGTYEQAMIKQQSEDLMGPVNEVLKALEEIMNVTAL